MRCIVDHVFCNLRHSDSVMPAILLGMQLNYIPDAHMCHHSPKATSHEMRPMLCSSPILIESLNCCPTRRIVPMFPEAKQSRLSMPTIPLGMFGWNPIPWPKMLSCMLISWGHTTSSMQSVLGSPISTVTTCKCPTKVGIFFVIVLIMLSLILNFSTLVLIQLLPLFPSCLIRLVLRPITWLKLANRLSRLLGIMIEFRVPFLFTPTFNLRISGMDTLCRSSVLVCCVTLTRTTTCYILLVKCVFIKLINSILLLTPLPSW